MNEVQLHHLTMASVFFSGLSFLAVLALSARRRTWFVGVAAAVVLSSGVIFVSVGLLEPSDPRAQALGWLFQELPFIFVLSCICMAQAGLLPARLRVVGLQEAIRRPRLRAVLASAPTSLSAAWFSAFAFGMARPLPVLQAFAPAPPHYLLLKGTLLLPEAFYCALAGWIFLKAGRRASAPRLRSKNLLYSAGTFCGLLMALQVLAHAMARVWFPSDLLQTSTDFVLASQNLLLAASASAYGLGLALHHAPTFSKTLVGREYPLLLHAVNRFEGIRWHLVQGGKVRGLIRTSYHVREAAGRNNFV